LRSVSSLACLAVFFRALVSWWPIRRSSDLPNRTWHRLL
jgi:hypothetical protein